MTIQFTIPGQPVQWKAPAFSKRGTYSTQGIEKANYEAYIDLQMQGNPIKGPLEVIYRYFLRRPIGHYGSGKNSCTMRQSAPIYPIVKKLDIDNLDKWVSDRMNKIVYLDDSQIIRKFSERLYSNSGNPRTEITVSLIEESKS